MHFKSIIRLLLDLELSITTSQLVLTLTTECGASRRWSSSSEAVGCGLEGGHPAYV